MDQVIGWADADGSEPMLLLADFGEGKSVFTYCLTRRLSEEIRGAPEGALFPLRIPLREFREAGSARGLLERRLTEVGATIADWRGLTKQVRTLAILDGFDEMSADLSPDAITANLRDIRSCLIELSGSKVLVTSRQRVLDGSRDWRRILGPAGAAAGYEDRVRAAPPAGAVPGAVHNGRGFGPGPSESAQPLRPDRSGREAVVLGDDQGDAAGSAARPFSETILYDTYINKSLRTKWDLLFDPGEELTGDELIENLKDVLEDVAVRLQEANGAYHYLRDYQEDRGKIAEQLWKMRDQAVPRDRSTPAAQDDAANRVGIRSLLKAVPAPTPAGGRSTSSTAPCASTSWPGRSPIPWPRLQRARRLLSAAPLLPEVAHFAASILHPGGTTRSLWTSWESWPAPRRPTVTTLISAVTPSHCCTAPVAS